MNAKRIYRAHIVVEFSATDADADATADEIARDIRGSLGVNCWLDDVTDPGAEHAAEPVGDWSHNVQHLRVEFPRADDATHHATLYQFSQELERLADRHGLGVVAYGGFVRADRNWDAIGTMRGENRDGLDNEP
jgi:hypothetical protein